MSSSEPLPGVHPSPNIQATPELYKLENRAADPDGLVEAAMRAVQDWAGRDVVDVGCGTGFHLPRFAATARSVVGVEPHATTRERALRRCASLGLANVSVASGSAELLPLRDDSADVVHARFAYFFGPGSEPGIAECARVLRRGGVLFVVDNDLRGGTFASWLARSPWAPPHSADEVQSFWSAQGFARVSVASRWEFATREDFAAVIGIEFPPALAAEIVAVHPGTVVDYRYALYWKRF